jgi:hypothetical protein
VTAGVDDLAELVHETGNPILAQRLRTTVRCAFEALQAHEQANTAWGADIDSPKLEARARELRAIQEDAEEDVDRVLADVDAFLSEKGGV